MIITNTDVQIKKTQRQQVAEAHRTAQSIIQSVIRVLNHLAEKRKCWLVGSFYISWKLNQLTDMH